MNDDKNFYMDEDIDENLIPYGPFLFAKKSDSEEDKELAKNEQLKYGLTEEVLKTTIAEINNNSDYKYADDDIDYPLVPKKNEITLNAEIITTVEPLTI